MQLPERAWNGIASFDNIVPSLKQNTPVYFPENQVAAFSAVWLILNKLVT